VSAVDPVEVKRCARCELTKPSEAFGPRAHTRDRLQSWCKDCGSQYQRDRRSSDEAVAVRDRAQVAAYRAAETALRKRHRDEFDALYDAERQKRGLT